MQQTFLFIEESWLNPVLVIWILLGLITLAWFGAKKGLESEFWSTLAMFVVGGVIIKFVVPMVMIVDPRDDGGKVLAIRGYGVFLLIGVVAGVGLAMHRARQLGLRAEVTQNLCFVLFGAGIVGARVFYVVQYWPQFQVDGKPDLAKIINMTEGGLVVFGSIIGGALGGVVFLKMKKLPTLLMLDVLAPCMMIGLSIGRIGCLMNGCCWGGVCDTQMSIQFPEGSPPYARHVETGELFGMKARPIKDLEAVQPRPVVEVLAGSPADKAGIKVGDEILDFRYNPNPSDDKLPEKIIYLIQRDQASREVVFPQSTIASFSLPVHPTQIYSSINALLVFLFLWFFFPSRTRDGQVIGLLMIIYAIGRFLLEMIRSDELGQFGTGLTASQITSLATVSGGIAILVYGFKQEKRTETFYEPVSGLKIGRKI